MARLCMWTSISNKIPPKGCWIPCPGIVVASILTRIAATLFLVILALLPCEGQDWLDQLQTAPALKSPNGSIRSDVTVYVDAEGYYIDQRPPGLLYPNESFFNPRTTFFVDTELGKHFYSLLQARVDRGFDPGERNVPEARLDEYLLRWTPCDSDVVNLQFGKFATAVGNWVVRHDSWDNPLITPPLPYANITTISDGEAPASPAEFLGRRNLAVPKDEWAPVIWGPAYATGGEVFGSILDFDYSAEIKNTSVSSHPDEWGLSSSMWNYPTFDGRLGFRPSPAWKHGVSFSIGPYLYAEAQPSLPPGKSLSDYNQINLGYDISYAWHRWQLWGEVFLTRFQVPNVGDADLLTYYLEAKYQISANFYAAARWNQQIFGSVANGGNGRQTWGDDMIQVDLALGYRFTRHLQAKVQYSFNHRDASLQQGAQLVAGQITLKF